MNGWELGEEVILPSGEIGIICGMMQMHGRLLIIITPPIEELIEASMRGFPILPMYPEEQVRKVDA